MGTETLWEDIYKKFWDKIEKDTDFFSYNNISSDIALEIAKERSKSLIIESIIRFTLSCTPDVDFNDYDEELEQFNFYLTNTERDLIARIMRERYFDRDKSLLKAFEVRFSPTDLKMFSPAEERKSFISMYEGIVKENDKLISNYKDKDRITGELKKIDHSKYEY